MQGSWGLEGLKGVGSLGVAEGHRGSLVNRGLVWLVWNLPLLFYTFKASGV